MVFFSCCYFLQLPIRVRLPTSHGGLRTTSQNEPSPSCWSSLSGLFQSYAQLIPNIVLWHVDHQQSTVTTCTAKNIFIWLALGTPFSLPPSAFSFELFSDLLSNQCANHHWRRDGRVRNWWSMLMTTMRTAAAARSTYSTLSSGTDDSFFFWQLRLNNQVSANSLAENALFRLDQDFQLKFFRDLQCVSVWNHLPD